METLRDGVIKIEDVAGMERAYSVVDGREMAVRDRGPEEFLAVRDRLAEGLGIEGDFAFEYDVALDALGIATVDDAGAAIRVRTVRLTDLAPTGEVSYPVPPEKTYSGTGLGEEEIRLELSDGGRWVVLEIGSRLLVLIDRTSMTAERTYDFVQGHNAVRWGLGDRRMIVSQGCICEGEDATSVRIDDVVSNRKVFSLEYGPLELQWHEGIRWRDDFIWLVEADRIRVWDLVDGTLSWTVPVAPRFPSRGAAKFTHNAWLGSNRVEEEGRVVYPFIAWMPGRYEAIIARASAESIELMQRRSEGTVKKSHFALPGIEWMAYLEDRLVLVTGDGGVHTLTGPELAGEPAGSGARVPPS